MKMVFRQVAGTLPWDKNVLNTSSTSVRTSSGACLSNSITKPTSSAAFPSFKRQIALCNSSIDQGSSSKTAGLLGEGGLPAKRASKSAANSSGEAGEAVFYQQTKTSSVVHLPHSHRGSKAVSKPKSSSYVLPGGGAGKFPNSKICDHVHFAHHVFVDASVATQVTVKILDGHDCNDQPADQLCATWPQLFLCLGRGFGQSKAQAANDIGSDFEHHPKWAAALSIPCEAAGAAEAWTQSFQPMNVHNDGQPLLR